MNKSIFVFAILLGLALSASAYGAVPAKQSATITIGSWVKPAGDKNAAWQESIKANPGDKLEYRVDVENVSAQFQKNVTVQMLLGKNIIFTENVKIDNISAKYDSKLGFVLGDLAKSQTKVITFTATVAENEKLTYGQNELVAIFVLDKSFVSSADAVRVFVWRQGLAGISTGPAEASALNTGLTDNLSNFILLPILLALVCLFIFRKQLTLSMMSYEQSNHEAQYQVAQHKLEEKINSLK